MSRKPTFERLPDAWRRLDALLDDVVRRYLGVLDTSRDRAHDKTQELLDLLSVDKIPDRYLMYLGELIGHAWRNDQDHAWNRRRIREAIRRYSYKGNYECIGDLIAEHGGSWFEIVDMASRLWVWNRQGLLNRDDSHLLAADYWHSGAFVLRVLDDLDFDAFLEDFEQVRRGGSVWYFEIGKRIPETVCETVWDAVLMGETLVSAAHYGRFNTDMWLTYEGGLEIAQTTEFATALAHTGGSLTVDSMIRVDREDVTVDQGTSDNPLGEDAALIQEPAEIVVEVV